MLRDVLPSKRTLMNCLLLCLTLLSALPALADTAAAPAPVAPVAIDTDSSKVNSGDTAWMLTSAAMVLMMTGPGLALFYSGLVRRKNVLATMMQSFVLMAVVSVVWALVGYSLAFDVGNPFIGGLHFAFMKNVWMFPSEYASTIPHSTFMVYQCMFAVITPALICGAYAERMKFSSMLVFSVLWLLGVYCPLAHMVWGKGGLFNWAMPSASTIGALDFAGGTVVHISSGVSALICALVLGKRRGYGRIPMAPHSVVLSVIGAALLWVGWFGFNGGRALSARGGAGSTVGGAPFSGAGTGLGGGVAGGVKAGERTGVGGSPGAVGGLAGMYPRSRLPCAADG